MSCPWSDTVSGLALVTGGSGYFGSLLVSELARRGYRCRVLDQNDAPDRPPAVELIRGDVRDSATVRRACEGVDVVFHNVAQVPLAKSRALFESVNVAGTGTLLDACEDAGVAKVVHTSSSAIYGVPESNPLTESSPPRPAEAYGQAKLDAEGLCGAAVSRGLDVSIVRPRTILGHGRLGIFTLLFDWIADGADLFVLGRGENRYQFVHAADLADACIRAGERPGPAAYNVGTDRFGTMREALEHLVEHAGVASCVRSVPAAPAVGAMRITGTLDLTPFAAYHWIMYGRSLWFDSARVCEELGWTPRYSNDEMLAESFDWYMSHRASLADGASRHRSPVREGVLRLGRVAMRQRRRTR